MRDYNPEYAGMTGAESRLWLGEQRRPTVPSSTMMNTIPGLSSQWKPANQYPQNVSMRHEIFIAFIQKHLTLSSHFIVNRWKFTRAFLDFRLILYMRHCFYPDIVNLTNWMDLLHKIVMTLVDSQFILWIINSNRYCDPPCFISGTSIQVFREFFNRALRDAKPFIISRV